MRFIKALVSITVYRREGFVLTADSGGVNAEQSMDDIMSNYIYICIWVYIQYVYIYIYRCDYMCTYVHSDLNRGTHTESSYIPSKYMDL